MNTITDLQAGAVGAYLVCADLTLKGYSTYPAQEGLHYDLIADVDGRPIRIQVKASRAAKAIPQRKAHTPAYLFYVKRMGRGGSKRYTKTMLDVFAFVALDTREIAYMHTSKAPSTVQIRSDKQSYNDDVYIARQEEIRRLRAEGLSYGEISKRLNGMSRSHIWSLASGKRNVRKCHKYFSDYPFEEVLEK